MLLYVKLFFSCAVLSCVDFVCNWKCVIYMRHSSPNRRHYFLFFFHVIWYRASRKNTVYEVFDFLKFFLDLMSPKMTQKTENDTVGRHRFGWNSDSIFYVTKQIFRAMGECRCGFGLEVMRKSKLKKKRKLLNMIVPNFLYTTSMLLLVTRTIRTQSLLFIKNFSSAHFTRNNLWSKQSGTLHIASSLFSIFHKVISMKKNDDQVCFEMSNNNWLSSFTVGSK